MTLNGTTDIIPCGAYRAGIGRPEIGRPDERVDPTGRLLRTQRCEKTAAASAAVKSVRRSGHQRILFFAGKVDDLRNITESKARNRVRTSV